MKKEDKGIIIGQLTEIIKEYPNFYLTDIEALDAEKTSKLRRECFKNEVKLVVVKNNLLKKALENVEGDLVFSKDGDRIWKCRNCGHIVIGKEAPEICPVCSHPKAYFEIKAENY